MEAMIAFALMVAFLEWRDHKRSQKYAHLLAEMKSLKRKQDRADLLLDSLLLDAKTKTARMQDLKELSDKIEILINAHAETAAEVKSVMKDYKLNGPPLALKRNQGNDQHFDYIEGT